MDKSDWIDLTEVERPNDLVAIRLRCSRCNGGDDESPGGALTDPWRKPDDPETVVRCGTCGKRHSTESLEAITRV